MSEAMQTDAGRTNLKEGDNVEDFDQFHGRLANRLRKLQTWTDNAEGDYNMEVTYSPGIGGSDRVSVVIDSDEWIGNKGEIGDMHFHIILRQRGGISLAQSRRTLVDGTTDYLDKNDTVERAWRELRRSIKGAL